MVPSWQACASSSPESPPGIPGEQFGINTASENIATIQGRVASAIIKSCEDELLLSLLTRGCFVGDELDDLVMHCCGGCLALFLFETPRRGFIP